MLYIDSFYKYIRENVLPNNTKIKLSRDEQEKIHIDLRWYLTFFPRFPDIELITDLSCENYERKICRAKLIFLPFENNIDSSSASFLYDNKDICFNDDSKRLIRKILESLDDLHIIVLGYENNNYYIKGIINESDINNFFTDYYFIEISGYLDWSARCKNFNLFDYYKGKFCEFNHSSSDLNKYITKIVSSLEIKYSKSFISRLEEILRLIDKQKHGTSFVIFYADEDAKNETERLCNAGRGFKAKSKLLYKDMCETIPQLTKIDGGLIFDIELNCYAYGCIYDGYIDDLFSGSLDSGARYNSVKLYVETFNKNHSSTCLGIVFSDDGGVKYVT